MKLWTRIKFWVSKHSDPQFMWGHPDEYDDAERFYYRKSNNG